MSMTPEQIADWFGGGGTAEGVSVSVKFMPGESGGIPEDPQVEAQMIFDAWKKFYQDNPAAKPPAGAAPDEKRAYAAAHPAYLGDYFADEKFTAKAKVQEWLTANRTRDAIVAAVLIVALVLTFAGNKKAAAA